MPHERTAAERQAAYTAIESEQARDARKVAESLFRPKPPPKIEDHLVAADAALPQEGTRVSRILKVSERPELPPQMEMASKSLRHRTEAHVASIPAPEHDRIRTLATYGMTIRQVADLYEVAESEIERIVED